MQEVGGGIRLQKESYVTGSSGQPSAALGAATLLCCSSAGWELEASTGEGTIWSLPPSHHHVFWRWKQKKGTRPSAKSLRMSDSRGSHFSGRLFNSWGRCFWIGTFVFLLVCLFFTCWLYELRIMTEHYVERDAWITINKRLFGTSCNSLFFLLWDLYLTFNEIFFPLPRATQYK